jgi:hypothetical protein
MNLQVRNKKVRTADKIKINPSLFKKERIKKMAGVFAICKTTLRNENITEINERNISDYAELINTLSNAGKGAHLSHAVEFPEFYSSYINSR